MLKKKISRLQPVDDREASERHYAEIHHTFARDQFLRSAPDLVGYHPNRAIGQYDLNGTFRERPDAWRFVVTRWESRDEHTLGFMDERLRNLFYGDRQKCIGAVAACDVDERVLVDRMTGRQTSLVKYLFRYAPEQFGDDQSAFDAQYESMHLPAIVDALDHAAGIRLFVTNRAQQEAELEHRPDGTMAYTGRYLAPSTYCFEEYYFDHDGLGEAFFTSPAVLALLRDGEHGRLHGYQVEEKCGVDRRVAKPDTAEDPTLTEVDTATEEAAPSRGPRAAVTALRYPDFARFWTGALVSNCGTWMQNVTVPYVVYQETGNAALVGLAGFLQFIPVLFVGPVGGWLADRYPRRSVLIATQTVHALLATVLWLVYTAGGGRPAVLIAIVFLTGIVQGLNIPAWQAYVGELVPRTAVLSAVTLNSAQFNAARAIGPSIAGVVLAQLGASWAFFVNALSYAAVIGVLASIVAEAGAVDRIRQPLRRQFAASWRCVRNSPGIVSAMLLLGVGAGLGQPIFQLMPVLAAEVFGVDAWRFGLMAAALGAGGVLGAVALGALGGGHRRSRLVQVSLSCYAVVLIAVGLAPTYAFAVAALLLAGALYLAVVAPLNTSVQLQAPAHLRGGVFAIYVMTFNVAYPVGSLVQGVVAQLKSPRAAVVLNGALIVVAVVVATWRRAFPPLDADRPQASAGDPISS